MLKATFEITKRTPSRIIIKDTGRECMSVTNDAEAVVKDLYEDGILRDEQLLYYDSEGRLDEIKHDGKGVFTGFAPGPKDEWS